MAQSVSQEMLSWQNFWKRRRSSGEALSRKLAAAASMSGIFFSVAATKSQGPSWPPTPPGTALIWSQDSQPSRTRNSSEMSSGLPAKAESAE
jgi:hypothetical protein